MCFCCNGAGHFTRECPKFLEEQKSARVASSAGINVVEINFVVSSSNSWIGDSGGALIFVQMCRCSKEVEDRQRVKCSSSLAMARWERL